ncbi:MAG TPA: sodium:solute symporter family protein [Gemmatimonadota bacterium]|nr:sodium:solute symporter family protein [Gemmatimonadota bacterium]
MPEWAVVFAVTCGYLVVSLSVGLLSGRKTSSSTEGWVAGDRSLGFIVLYFIMGASIFSAFAFLGGPGWAYSRGAACYYIIAYGTVGLAPWYFFGPRVARLGRKFGYVTQAQLFMHRFESPAISGVLAVISLVAFLPYLMLQMSGAGYVFEVLTRGHVPFWAGAALAYGVVLIYVFKSGVMGVGWTNTLQGIFMMGLAWGLGLYLPHKLYGGVGPMFEAIMRKAPKMLSSPGLGPDGSPWTWGAFSSAILISVLGFSMWPHYFMKMYTARSERTLKRTVVWYPTFQFFLIPIMLIGFSGVLAFPGVKPADAILPTIVTSIGLSPVIVGIFCAGALAASMSTGDALLHASASVAVKDFWRPLFQPDLSDRAEHRAMKVLVVLFGALAYYLAIVGHKSLVALLLFGYGFIAQLAPLACATFFWARSTKAGALSGLLVGFAVTVVWNLVPSLQWAGVRPGIYGVVANVIVLVAVSLATPPMDEEHVAEFVVS